MGPLWWRKGREGAKETTDENPFPVQIIQSHNLPPVSGRTITRVVKVPGIGTGAAYTAGEAFGTPFRFNNVFDAQKKSGTVVGAFILDLDDEGIQVDIPLFTRRITATTDNNAFAVTDNDLMYCRGVVSITEFFNWNVCQFGQRTGLSLWIQGESAHLETQLVIQGAANIAAGKEPYIGLIVVPD